MPFLLQKKKKVAGATAQEVRSGSRFVDMNSLAACQAAGLFNLANQSGRRAVTLAAVQLPHTRVSYANGAHDYSWL